MIRDEPGERTTHCHECQGGICHLQYQTYITWTIDELITVPNFPIWVCDMCGWREFDTRALTWLVTLLNPPTRRSGGSRRRSWRQDDGKGDSPPQVSK